MLLKEELQKLILSIESDRVERTISMIDTDICTFSNEMEELLLIPKMMSYAKNL